MAPGRHQLSIEPARDRSARLPSGIYFYRIEAAESVLGGRCVFIE